MTDIFISYAGSTADPVHRGAEALRALAVEGVSLAEGAARPTAPPKPPLTHIRRGRIGRDSSRGAERACARRRGNRALIVNYNVEDAYRCRLRTVVF